MSDWVAEDLQALIGLILCCIAAGLAIYRRQHHKLCRLHMVGFVTLNLSFAFAYLALLLGWIPYVTLVIRPLFLMYQSLIISLLLRERPLGGGSRG